MNKRKLLLVSANRFATPYPVYPIGLSYIHSYLSEKIPELEIRIFDFNLYTISDFISYLESYQPDYTGISLRNVDDVDSFNQNSFVKGYKEIIDTVKSTIITRIIIGGSAFSIFPKELFEYFSPEFGIFGEGEESIYHLITCLENKTDFSKIEGLVYKDGGEIKMNARTSFIRNLDLGFSDNLADFYWDKSGMMNVQTKRGCPHSCIYCTYPVIEGHKVRTLNADKLSLIHI